MRQTARLSANMDLPTPLFEDMTVTVSAGISSSTSQRIGRERASEMERDLVQSIGGEPTANHCNADVARVKSEIVLDNGSRLAYKV